MKKLPDQNADNKKAKETDLKDALLTYKADLESIPDSKPDDDNEPSV